MMGGPLSADRLPLGCIPKRKGREKVLKIDGAFAPKVLRFDSPYRG